MLHRRLSAMLATGVCTWLGATLIVSAQGQTWTTHGPDGGNVRTLAMSQQTPSTMYAGVTGGVFRTTDNAVSWQLTSNGLPTSVTVFALATDPQNASVVYAGTSSGAFKSSDSGDNWSAINTGLPAATSVLAI